LIAIFTKFDAQIIQEYVKLENIQERSKKWDKARTHAENTYMEVYLSKVLNTNFPPRVYVKLEGERDENCTLGFNVIILIFNRHAHGREELSRVD